MNGDLASFQGRELLFIIVNQNNFVPEVGKARPGHQPNVSRSHDCNMHPLLRISHREQIRQLLYQFSCGGCANHLPPHWSDITSIRDDSYSFCGRKPSAAPTLIVPSLQNIEYPGAKIQLMRLRSSLAFQLPPAENSSPSAPSPTLPLRLTPECLRSQTLPAPMNNQTCRSAGTQSSSSAPRIKSRADRPVPESSLALNPAPTHSDAAQQFRRLPARTIAPVVAARCCCHATDSRTRNRI